MNLPIFYLKINTNSDFAIACFEHWVKIVKSLGADYYIVCDDKELQKRVINKENADKFFPSYVDAKKLLHKIVDPKWLKTGAALLTPFLHAKENGFASFFNIDADDTVMCCGAEKCAEILKSVCEYANKTDVDCFSLDMHSTAFERFYPHWTFGVAYCKTQTDYVSKILTFEETEENRILRKKNFCIINIDDIFSILGKNSQIKIGSFYIENLYFIHNDFWIHFCANQRFLFKECSNHTKISWHIEESEIKDGMLIPNRFVKFDIGVTQKECLDFLAENYIFSNFVGRSDSTDVSMILLKLSKKNKKLVLFGAGRDGLLWFRFLQYSNIEIDYFCDNSQKLWGTEVQGVKVIGFEQLKKLSEQEELYVIISTSIYHNEIKRQLSGINVEILNEESENRLHFRKQLAKTYKLFDINRNTPIYLYGDCEFFKSQTNFYSRIIGYNLMDDIAGFVDIEPNKNSGNKVFSLDEISEDSFIIVGSKDSAKELFNRGKIYHYHFTRYWEFECNYKRMLYSGIRKFQNAYSGERCFIIGNGPSLNLADIEMLHENNEFVLVSNNFYKWFDKTAFRPDFYFLADEIATNVEDIADVENINFIADIYYRIDKNIRNLYYFEQSCWIFYDYYPHKPFFSEDIALTFAAGSISYIMLQMAVNMGFTEIYMLGMDNIYSTMVKHDGTVIQNNEIKDHFYNQKLKIAATNIDMYEQACSYMREYCDKKGIKIRNATRGGKLEVFERVDFDSLFLGNAK